MIVDDQTPFKGTAQGVALCRFGIVQIKRIEIFLRRECENALLAVFCLHRAELGAAETVGIGGVFGKKQSAGGKCVDGFPIRGQRFGGKRPGMQPMPLVAKIPPIAGDIPADKGAEQRFGIKDRTASTDKGKVPGLL